MLFETEMTLIMRTVRRSRMIAPLCLYVFNNSSLCVFVVDDVARPLQPALQLLPI